MSLVLMACIYLYSTNVLPDSQFVCLFCRSFDPRKECNLRMYSYLLPADVIGIKSHFSAAEIDGHIADFNDILNTFEVRCFCPHIHFSYIVVRFWLLIFYWS